MTVSGSDTVFPWGMPISSPCGRPFFYFSPQHSSSSSSSSVFFLRGEQCCKYVSWLSRMLPPWPRTAPAHPSLPLSPSISLTCKHTHIWRRATGPLLHKREDSLADCPIRRQHKTHIMYIIFRVCLHRHSIGVLGVGKHVNTTHISFTGYLQSLHLSQCQWKCEVFISLLFGSSRLNLSPFPYNSNYFQCWVQQVFMMSRNCQCS